MTSSKRQTGTEAPRLEGSSPSLAAADVGLWTWGPASDGLRCDGRAAEILGLSADMAHPLESVASRLAEGMRGRLEPAFAAALETGRRFELELRLEGEGAPRWVILRGNRLPGRKDALGGICAEITDRMEKRAATERELEFLRVSVEAGRLGHWSVDLATGQGPRSSLVDEVFGLTDGQASWTQEAFLERVHEDDREVAAEALRRTMATGDDWELELRIRRQDDDGERWIWARGGLHHDAAGRPDRLFGVVRDVTDRRLIEEELRAATTSFEAESQWLEALLDLMPIPFVLIDPAGERVTFANRAAEGLGSGDFLRGAEAEAGACTYPDGEPVAAEDRPTRRIARGERVDGLELIWRSEDRTHHLLVHGELLPGMFGRPPVGLCAFQDVGRLKEAETALREADQRKDEFIATLGHELRNPLSPIANGLELLAIMPAGADESAEIREVMARQVRHMTRLIDDLLDISRIARGKIDVRLEPTDLDDVVERALEAVAPLAGRAGHRIETVRSDEPVVVLGDPGRLVQIVSNLLSNAVKFTPQKGRIAVETRRKGDEVVLRVVDEGVGIEPERLGQVFEPFAQVGSAQHVGESGLGIGLTLVRRLTRLLGGEVSVDSAGKGKGATFTLRFPAGDGEPRETREEEVVRPGARPSFKILVVDDSRAIVHLFTRLLEALGHRTEGAANGDEALGVMERFRPDVIFSDVFMPVMNGYELAAHLKARSGVAPTLVAMTGLGRNDDRDRALSAGFDHHVAKPADVKRLQALLDEIAAERRARGLF